MRLIFAFIFLKQMKEESALLAIEDLSNQNLDVIKNVSAYFKGVCRRRNDENKDGVQFGSMGGGAGGTQEQGHAYNPALQDVQSAHARCHYAHGRYGYGAIVHV